MNRFIVVSVVIFALILGACGAGEQPLATNTPEPAAQEAVSQPTPTVLPPTPTPVPTEPAAAPAVEEPAAPAAAEPETEPAAEEAPVSDVRTFVIVPDQSRATYIVAEEFFGGALDRLGIQPGLTDTIGSTQEVSGEMQLDFGNPASPVVSSRFEVNLESLTSDQSRRDQRIREANLESSRYPLAEFTITSLENAPATLAEGQEISFQANGDLTIREITRPATFDVTATLAGDTITGVATTQLAMTDFGFEPPNFANLFSVANEFTVRVEFTFQQQ